LKGLVEGRGMDPETGEGKLWNVLSELVGDFAAELKELREDQEDLADSVENVEIGLEYLEDILQDGNSDPDEDLADYDDDDDDDGVYPFAGFSHASDDDIDEEAVPEDDFEDDGIFYEAECPSCGEVIEFDDEILDEGSVRCPGCGALLEFSAAEDEPDITESEEDPEGDDSASADDGDQTES
ncbi:MAG: hypothetical protein IKE47_00330, partial [Oscillospiraceae bacterium]|nr:hypothetical protein [Oscillospiraceae bacterium]